MNNKTLYGSWVFLFILCAGLGFIPEPAAFRKAVLVLLALLFFLPPAWLFIRAVKAGEKKPVLLIRRISLASLVLTLALLVANLLSVNAPDSLGVFLHILLTVVSSPMLCGQYWFISLFLWSCLLTGSFLRQKK